MALEMWRSQASKQYRAIERVGLWETSVFMSYGNHAMFQLFEKYIKDRL